MPMPVRSTSAGSTPTHVPQDSLAGGGGDVQEAFTQGERHTEQNHIWSWSCQRRVEGEIQAGAKEELVPHEGGETLAQVAQRGGRCPIPGNIPGQVGRGSEHPELGGDVPAHGRGLGWVASKGPFPPKPVCDSTVLCWHNSPALSQ